MFALAEASSGEFLLNNFKEYELDIIPVVRKVEMKFSKPANGSIYSKACLVNSGKEEIYKELITSKRVIIKVKVELFNESNDRLFSSIFDWFITNRD